MTGVLLFAFCIGNQFWAVRGHEEQAGYPKSIHTLGLPETVGKIDAAVSDKVKKKTYFFVEDKYWRWDAVRMVLCRDQLENCVLPLRKHFHLTLILTLLSGWGQGLWQLWEGLWNTGASSNRHFWSVPVQSTCLPFPPDSVQPSLLYLLNPTHISHLTPAPPWCLYFLVIYCSFPSDPDFSLSPVPGSHLPLKDFSWAHTLTTSAWLEIRHQFHGFHSGLGHQSRCWDKADHWSKPYLLCLDFHSVPFPLGLP